MDFKQIKAFLTVVETGSFSAAAKKLYISQPTISVRVRLLEEQLNATLFDRSYGRKILLTPEGEKIYNHFKEGYEIFKSGYQLFSDTEKNVFVISCPNNFGIDVAPELVMKLYDLFPQYEFHLKYKGTLDIIEEITSGFIDVGFAYFEKTEVDKFNIENIKVSNQKNVLVCSNSHPLIKYKYMTPELIKDERIFVYHSLFHTASLIKQFLKENGVLNQNLIEIGNIEWMKLMVKEGRGIAFFRKNIIFDELQNKQLFTLHFKKDFPVTPISLLLGNRVPEPVKNSITEIVQDYFK